MTGEAPLIAVYGYYARGEPGDRCCDRRDREAMRRDWEVHGENLIAEWVGEIPMRQTSRWVSIAPGGPGTRPWGWWMFGSAGPLEGNETELDYLIRHDLLRPGEAERLP